MTLADQILALDDTVYEAVTIPEWVIDGKPVTLTVRSIGSDEKDRLEESCLRVTKKLRRGKVVREYVPTQSSLRAKLVALSVCLGAGNKTPVFTEEQIQQLGKKNAAAMDRLAEVAQRLSATTDDDIKELVGKDGQTLDGSNG